jgi:hypothetical protein
MRLKVIFVKQLNDCPGKSPDALVVLLQGDAEGVGFSCLIRVPSVAG